MPEAERLESVWRLLRPQARGWEEFCRRVWEGHGKTSRRALLVHLTITPGDALCVKCGRVGIPVGTQGIPETISCPECGGRIAWIVVPKVEQSVVRGSGGGIPAETALDWATDALAWLGDCTYPGCAVRRADVLAHLMLVDCLSNREAASAYWQRTGEGTSDSTVRRLERWWASAWNQGPSEAARLWAERKGRRRQPNCARRYA